MIQQLQEDKENLVTFKEDQVQLKRIRKKSKLRWNMIFKKLPAIQ